MDKSETYIKMCNCEEIQELMPRVHGQYDFYESGDIIKKTPFIWLPRQDQLQEMVKRDILIDLIDDFYLFVSSRYIGELACFVFTSMEQLWLAFVMKEKYNKIWDGDKWSEKL